ncbi:DUF4272 domain-containing protein [Limibacter armeniacum]|uniref:DUF4272 domain-containing protein n=1 Tax=Limibacter armeniacum TaxID=466084 RepID=UPI002FE590CB
MRKFLFANFFWVIACTSVFSQNEDTSTEKERVIEEKEFSDETANQVDRKQKSLDYCKQHGIPTADHLKKIKEEDQVVLRTKEEIVNRALALCYIGLKSEGIEDSYLTTFESKYNLLPYLTPVETTFVESESPSVQQVENANWRYESLHLLLWTLGYIDTLSFPEEKSDVSANVKIVFEKTREELIQQAKLRTKEEILDQADLYYRVHWACVDAGVKNQPVPANLNANVVYERHYSLNWLIRYMELDWDNDLTDI